MNNRYMKLSNRFRVTKVNRKSAARVIGNTEVGDILEVSIYVRHGGGYQPNVTLENLRTGETVSDRMTLIAKSLYAVEYEEAKDE